MVSDLKLASYADPYWIEAVLRDYRDEVHDEAPWHIILIKESIRRLLWYLCDQLEINYNRGIPGSACRLLERYLARYLRIYLRGQPGHAEWTRHKAFLGSRYYLLAVTCIRLAAKMSDTATSPNVSTIQSLLLQVGVTHSKEEINATEFHVYKALDYRIPLWTSLDTAQFLAARVGIIDKFVMQAVAIVIDSAEFYRCRIQLHMQDLNDICNSTTLPPPITLSSTINTLHLCAGSVCATARFMRAPEDYVLILSSITCAKPSYIAAITDSIFNIILKDIQ